MGIREEALTRVLGLLKAGDTKGLKQAYHDFRLQGNPALFRDEYHLKQPVVSGQPFDEDYQLTNKMGHMTKGELSGIYFAKNIRDLDSLKNGYNPGTKAEVIQRLKDTYRRDSIPPEEIDFNVRAVPLPGTREIAFPGEEWKHFTDVPTEELTKQFKEKADFVTFPDIAVGNKHTLQTVQINPNSSLVNYRDFLGNSRWRLLGLGSALGIGGSMALDQSNEAQAMPIGEAVKRVGKSILRSDLSSASERLAGTVVEGKTIKEVRIGKGNWRTLIFDDGSGLPVTTDYVNALARAKGTQDYVGKLATQDQDSNLVQALKSLKMHEDRSDPWATRDSIRRQHKEYLQKTKDVDSNLTPDTVAVQRGRKYFLMPKVYVDLLEPLGYVTRVEGTREQRLFKPFKKERINGQK